MPAPNEWFEVLYESRLHKADYAAVYRLFVPVPRTEAEAGRAVQEILERRSPILIMVRRVNEHNETVVR